MSSGFDASVPNMARVYDYWLGGKDHYAADREEAERLLRIYPPLRDLVRENRVFLAQAITWTAGQGIGQFLDLGAGLPTVQNTHEVARAVNPAAQVAYIDTDPVVLSHARALSPGNCLRNSSHRAGEPCHRGSRAQGRSELCSSIERLRPARRQ